MALPRQYLPHSSGVERFSPFPKKYSKMSRSPLGVVESYVEVQGMEVLYDHFVAAAALVDVTMPEILNVVGDLGVEEARRLAPYDTGATHDSITIVGGSSKSSSGTFGFRALGESQWWVEVGPETFYSPFLEYGTVYMTPRPFMLPALDLMELILQASVSAVMNAVAEGQSAGSGGGSAYANMVMSDPRVSNPFSSIRSHLYSGAKFMGDLSILGGRQVFGPLRTAMYGAARTLGDVGSIMNQTLSSRISNRLSGRVTGRLIGFGSASLSFGKTYSAFPGGSGGHRLYQRFAGSHTSLAGVSTYGASALVDRIFG